MDELLCQVSQTDKCDQLHPIDVWHTKTIHVQDEEIPGFYHADGPKGVGDDVQHLQPTAIRQVSGVNVGLGACIDIVRDPRAGRTQENLGEDPYLAGKVGAAFVRGVQSWNPGLWIIMISLNLMTQM